MGVIQVSSQQLRREAENLQSLNQELKNQIDELELKEYGMQGMWEGQAKEAFHAVFLRDREQMELFRSLVVHYIQVLHEMIQKYEQAEAMNIEIASRRSY